MAKLLGTEVDSQHSHAVWEKWAVIDMKWRRCVRLCTPASGSVLSVAGGHLWSQVVIALSISTNKTRVARSTTESEYIAGEAASREINFFRYLFEDMGYKVELPRPLGMDNQSAIQAAKNPEHQGRMKHMNPIYHGFRESVGLGEVSPFFTPTLAMPADILTKVLACNKLLGLGL